MTRALLIAATVLAYALVQGPVIVVVLAAFTNSDAFAFPPSGLSLRWFEAFLRTDSLREAFVRSFAVAGAASLLATVAGTLAALGLAGRRSLWTGPIQALFLAPLIFPALVYGLALLLFFNRIGSPPAFLALVVAHAILGLPFVFRSVLASLEALDPALREAGASLRAGPVRAFVHVVLPLIWPGMAAGALFAFVLSLGELNAALFLTGPGVTTLPIELFGYLQFQGGQLVVAAASAAQIAAVLLLAGLGARVVGLGRLVRPSSAEPAGGAR